MGKHTEGPWGRQGNKVFPKAGMSILHHWDGVADPDVLEANARLIAAAPELLELVQDLKASLPEDPEIDQRIDAVLAKATGQDND